MPGRTTHKNLTVFALVASIAMSALEATVVGTAMPTVIADLGGLDRYGWVGAAYMLASTVSMPLYGKIADQSGRRPTLVFGIILFLLGSLGSGYATSMDFLIVARAIQGLGAGAMQPVALTIIGDLFTLEQRGRVQAMLGAVWGISGMAGPIVGGIIVSTIGWRWVFWSNLPFGVVSVAVLFYAYHEAARPRTEVHLDWLGALVLTLSSVAILVGAERFMPYVLLPAGVLGLVAFVAIERRAASPVLPLELLSRRAIAVAGVASFVLGAAMMSAVMFLPLFAQAVLGATATEAGTTIAPMLIGWPLAAASSSRVLPRVGFRRPVIVGAGIVMVSLAATALALSPTSNLWVLRVAMFAYGLGMGLSLTAQLLAVQSGVEAAERGIATATNLFARSMGGALGAGAFGAMFTASLGTTVSAETAAALLDPHRRDLVTSEVVRVALADGLRPIFEVSAVLGLAAFLVSFFYPRDTPRGDVVVTAGASAH